MIGNWPSRQNLVTYLKRCGAQVEFVGGGMYRPWTHNCPDCDSILGSQIHLALTQSPPKQF